MENDCVDKMRRRTRSHALHGLSRISSTELVDRELVNHDSSPSSSSTRIIVQLRNSSIFQRQTQVPHRLSRLYVNSLRQKMRTLQAFAPLLLSFCWLKVEWKSTTCWISVVHFRSPSIMQLHPAHNPTKSVPGQKDLLIARGFATSACSPHVLDSRLDKRNCY